MRLERFEGCLENGKKVLWDYIDPYINIIVGDNGSGKTLLLKELNGSVEGFKSIFSSGETGISFDVDKSRGQYCYESILNSVRFAKEQGYDAILIDDIELFLSVHKQIKLIAEMREIAQDLQFFISTHSPYIYQNWSTQVFDIEDLIVD